MKKEEQLKKLIKIYNPQFEIEQVQFVRDDNDFLIFHVSGQFASDGVFNLYPAASIKSLVSGRAVKYYIVAITLDNLTYKHTS